MTIPRIELELVLVRHGQTKWNTEHRYLGHTDLSLLPDAVEQMIKLKGQFEKDQIEKLGFHKQEADMQGYCKITSDGMEYEDSWLDKGHSNKVSRDQIAKQSAELLDGFWRVFCSDLLRCRETLAFIAPSLEPVAVYDQRLREMNFGVWEGCTYEQLKDNPLYRSWIDSPSAVTPPEGESWVQFEERLSSFLSDLGQAAEDTFGHGAVTESNGLVFAGEMVTSNEQVSADELVTAKELIPVDERVRVKELACMNESMYAKQPHCGENSEYANQPDIQISTNQTSSISPLQRVLIVTHGGVIRNFLAHLIPEVTFYSAVAPSPGSAMILKVQWQNGQWMAVI